MTLAIGMKASQFAVSRGYAELQLLEDIFTVAESVTVTL